MKRKIAVVSIGMSCFLTGALRADENEKAKVFIGAYTLTEKSCASLADKGLERAYLSVGKDPLGAPHLSVQLFGDEAKADSLLLGTGTRQPLGVSEEVHGKVTETWETKFPTDSHLVHTRKVKGPKNEFQEISELRFIENKVNVEYKFPDENNRTQTCQLKPTLTLKQKRLVCKHIRIAQPEAAKELSSEDCVKNGKFTVATNDSGQLGITYSNTSIREDHVLTCEVNFDKPMGQFEPAVESCTFE